MSWYPIVWIDAEARLSVSTQTDQQLIECEASIERAQSYIDVGRALRSIRDERLYCAATRTFEDYCRVRWGFTRQRAHQLIRSYQAAEAVSSVDLTPPSCERVARELAKAKAVWQQREIWQKVHDQAGKVTAGKVAQVRRVLYGKERKQPKVSPGIDDMARTIDTICDRVQDVRREHAIGHRAWVTLLDRLGDAQKLLAKLARM